MTRRRRILSFGAKILAVFIVLLVYFAWPGRWTFTVSPETTYVTAPLDKKGYVDYVTALNERLSKDVTPENNANVLIWQALGPHPEGGTMPSEYFKWLGIDSPPEKGAYFVGYLDYLKERDGAALPVHREEFDERKLRSMKWPWRASDDPTLATWLKRNEKPLAVITEATKRSQYYNPLVPKRTEDWSPGLLESLLPNVQICREVTAALLCRAMLQVAEGRAEVAWQDLLACHRLARLVSRKGTIIQLLVSIAIDQQATRAETAFLDHVKLDSNQVSERRHDIQSLMPMTTVSDTINSAERFFLLDTIMLVVRQGMPFLQGLSSSNNRPKDNGFKQRLFTRNINWDPAFRNANRWCDRCAAAARLNPQSERKHEFEQISQELAKFKWKNSPTWAIEGFFGGATRRGELMGEIFVGLMLPAYGKVVDAEDRCEQWRRNLHLAFALAAFHADAGHYPAKLEELGPKYLDKIPNDLFSDKPLIYKPDGKGYLLYSVGPNGVDEEGQTYDDEPRGDDITVRMPVPPPHE